MPHPHRAGPLARLLIIPSVGLLVIACGSAAPSAPGASIAALRASANASAAPAGSPTEAAATDPGAESPVAVASEPAAPESGGTTAAGDVPDNAAFLTYRGGTPAFSIQYVEGWQVTSQPDGVVIRDKDSSETVAIAAPATDPAAWIASTDLPALQAQAGFKLDKQDRVKVGSSRYEHLVYHLPAPLDPVTGKQVPSTIDRYYVPGPAGLAVVSLSTPDGVDNVDAFRQMIESFKWK
jgi:hypothetical protein